MIKSLNNINLKTKFYKYVYDTHFSFATVNKLYESAFGSPIPFKDFFDRDNIQFDPQTGKLQMQQQMQPIGVTGDQHTAFWVGNALIRQGFQPSVADPNRLNIHCISPLQHQLVWPDGSQQTTHSVAELLTEIHQRIKCPTTV